ncbi:Pleiotropic drug resistance protein 2 [Linum perenne]
MSPYTRRTAGSLSANDSSGKIRPGSGNLSPSDKKLSWRLSELRAEKIAAARIGLNQRNRTAIMPSGEIRRGTRVIGMVKGSDGVRVLRSGRRLAPGSRSGERQVRRGIDEEEWLGHSVKKYQYKCKENGVKTHEVSKLKRKASEVVLPSEIMATKPVKKARLTAKKKVGSLPDKVVEKGAVVAGIDKMFGIVYQRKRKRVGFGKQERRGSKMYAIQFSRRQPRKKEGGGGEEGFLNVQTCAFVALVQNSGDGAASLLITILRYIKNVEVGLNEIARFLLTEPLNNVFASSGVRFLQDAPAGRNGICKFFNSKSSVPLFGLDFSVIPSWFMYMHMNWVLRMSHVSGNKSSEEFDDMMSDDEDGMDQSHICVNTLQKDPTSGADVSESRHVLTPLVRYSRLTTRSTQSKNAYYSRGVQKRRSSCRRRARNPAMLGFQRANGMLSTTSVGSRKKSRPLSSLVSKYKMRNPLPGNGERECPKEAHSAVCGESNWIDQSSCSADVLVIETDRCYRLKGASISIESSDSKESMLVVKKDGATRMSLLPRKYMKPSSINRVTHNVLWSGNENWKLEFPSRQDWSIFKELYKECVNLNLPTTTTVKVIPIPGVREVPDYENNYFSVFSMPDTYISVTTDEVGRALAKQTANYDIDSEDVEWLKEFNLRTVKTDGQAELLSEDKFELMIDLFEKAFYRSSDEFVDEKAAASHGSELAEAVYSYWVNKRKQKQSALLRVFQSHKVKKPPAIAKLVLRKRRSFKRHCSQFGKGKNPGLVQAMAVEQDALEERNAMLKVEGANNAAKRSMELAIAKRAKAQLLMENANLLCYKATIAGILGFFRVFPTKKRVVKILHEISGIVKPSRMTLLLGPPGSGKTTLLKALSGKTDKNLRYDLLAELSRREKAAGIKPDLEIDAFMKATSFPGQENSLVVDYVIKLLGLDICADILVGNDMRRGISGGQKKRVTTGEMLVGPAKVFLMDEISTGLDSSTTYQIVRFMKDMVHIMDITMIISLLQPAPETFELFDNIILLSEGQIVYQGPRENVLEFFESVGFKCPERKGVADFLQEVTSKNDQEQYCSYSIGRNLSEELAVPYDRSTIHRAALVKKKYGICNKELLKTCFARESLLLKRNAFVYIFKTTQLTIMSIICMTVFLRTEMKAGHLEDGNKFYGAMFYSLLNIMFTGISEVVLIAKRLPEFYKQRDSLFYPAWAFALPVWILRIPIAFIESFIWIVLTYYTIGFAPAANRCFLQAISCIPVYNPDGSGSIPLHWCCSKIRSASTCIYYVRATCYDIQSWMIWSYYISPMMYGQNAIVINEFLDDRWSAPNPDPRIPEPTVGKAFLRVRGMFVENKWYWISIGMLIGFTVLYNILFVLALTYLDPLEENTSVVLDENQNKDKSSSDGKQSSSTIQMSSETSCTPMKGSDEESNRRGMVLPFQPLSLAFSHVNYYVDMPPEMKSQGVEDERLQLLHDVSGAFRPGVLTALVGVSGAGKTTLMDVLAGRKTGGLIEGTINISGYPKNQQTFARISGYCEQNDIHSPRITVYESLLHSAWLRLSKDVSKQDRQMFIEEVMELIELGPLRNSIVGLPGVNGLSTEQRKRLTIAVELVANPSIIFMDEPTSGLDARAAAIVMRTVRNTVDTGRTVVCTIHQPSIDIFESFDELLLMKRGGQMTYAGSLGRHSHKLIEYFELNVDFAEIYSHSELYKRNQELIKELSTPTPGSRDLHFPTQYAQDFLNQFAACFMKQNRSYWQNPQYNGTRFLLTTGFGLLFGLIFWNKGQKTETEQDVFNLLGATYCSVAFLGGSCASGVMPVVSIERTILYREKAAGMYSELAYAIAQVSIETIYVALQTFIYSVILFLMIGYPWHASNFLWFYFFVFMSRKHASESIIETVFWV